MITLLVDEAYAFDYLAILEIKQQLSNLQSSNNWGQCFNHIKQQLGERFDEIFSSAEYKEMLVANKKTFDMVELAKENKCSARDVDKCNYERYKAKINLQNKFFSKNVSEIKFGYEKYES